MVDSLRCLVIGDLRWEHSPEGVALGGSAASFACRLRALGVDVTIATAVGRDAAGEQAIAELDSYGVDTSLVQRDSMLATSAAIVRLSATGEPSYKTIEQGAAGQLVESENLFERAHEFGAIYFNSYTQSCLVSGTTLHTFLSGTSQGFQIYDIHSLKRAPTRDELVAGFQRTSVVHIPESELSGISDSLGLPLLEPELFSSVLSERFGLKYCVITDAAVGVWVSSSTGETHAMPVRRKTHRDLRGWREAFLAGFVYKLRAGRALEQCCKVGIEYAEAASEATGALSPVSDHCLTSLRKA